LRWPAELSVETNAIGRGTITAIIQ
jgi:hypothetical protein